MKKRMMLLPVFILFLVVVVSAPSHYVVGSNYNYLDYSGHGDDKIETRSTFLIKETNGDSYYRVFENFNKNQNDHRIRYVSSEWRGIYRDFFDSELVEKDEYCDVDCPAGWKCKKESD